jgi:hypothetical protein
LELVRELELYQQAGLSNAEALQTATIMPARMTGMAKRDVVHRRIEILIAQVLGLPAVNRPSTAERH